MTRPRTSAGDGAACRRAGAHLRARRSAKPAGARRWEARWRPTVVERCLLSAPQLCGRAAGWPAEQRAPLERSSGAGQPRRSRRAAAWNRRPDLWACTGLWRCAARRPVCASRPIAKPSHSSVIRRHFEQLQAGRLVHRCLGVRNGAPVQASSLPRSSRCPSGGRNRHASSARTRGQPTHRNPKLRYFYRITHTPGLSTECSTDQFTVKIYQDRHLFSLDLTREERA